MQENSKKYRKLNLLWVGLTFPPASGGAAKYAETLARSIDATKSINSLTVLVERFPNTEKEKIYPNRISRVIRYFSYRAGRNTKGLVAYVRYAVDNLRLAFIPILAKKGSADAVIFHGWHLLNPSLLPLVLKLLKAFKICVVVDIRDNYLSDRKLAKLSEFDCIICCSQNIISRLRDKTKIYQKSIYIPVPISPLCRNGARHPIMEKLNLRPHTYLFSASGASDQKRFPLLFDAWRLLNERGLKVDLVVSGKTRDWSKRYEEPIEGGRLITTGSVSETELSALYESALVSVNLSNNESLGRTPLEAINFGRPMIFPSGVLEFSSFDSSYIAKDYPEDVADQIYSAARDGRFRSSYEITKHDPIVVAHRTVEAIGDTLRKIRNEDER